MEQAKEGAGGAPHPNTRLIEHLYASLRDRQPDDTKNLYAQKSYFRDIAFDLRGRDSIVEMWRFVCDRDINVTFREIRADNATGSGHWVICYAMSGSGRLVRNSIRSRFTFRDGMIIEHVDDCDPVAWADQAYAFPMSLVLGRLEFVRRYGARSKLARFVTRESVDM